MTLLPCQNEEFCLLKFRTVMTAVGVYTVITVVPNRSAMGEGTILGELRFRSQA